MANSMHVRLIAVLGAALTAPTLIGGTLPCAGGTVTSYLGAAPCSFNPGTLSVGDGTLQVTGYSTTFALSPDQTPVQIVPNGDFLRLIVGTGNASGSQAWVGPGTVSIQLSLVLPQLPAGLNYMTSQNGVDGCCEEPGFAFNFVGGTVTTSLDTTSTLSLPPDSDGRQLAVTTDWNYTVNSVATNGQSSDPGQNFYNLEILDIWLPHAQGALPGEPGAAPEPTPAAVLALGLTSIVLWRRARRGQVTDRP
jgi:hypothetical protein